MHIIGWAIPALSGIFAAMRQRIACGLIIGALSVISALVALLLSDAMDPGRVPPMLAFWAACGSGALLLGGLAMLEHSGGRALPQPFRG
jgi:ABC-type antimicrobial peptide transport system permease subunit